MIGIRDSDNTIPIDASTANLELFLDFMHYPDESGNHNWYDYKRLIALCDKYGCDMVHKRVRNRLQGKGGEAPWETFVIASKADDTSLARAALCCMNKSFSTFDLSRWLTKTMASQISLAYLLGLQHALYKTKERFSPLGDNPLNWAEVAVSFDPVR